MLSDKNCKILCLLFAIIIIGLLIRAFTNQGKLWGIENYRSAFSQNQNCDQVCSNNISVGECGICKLQQSFKK
jgi:hypothetical protein